MNPADDEDEADSGRTPQKGLTNPQRSILRQVTPGWDVWPVRFYDGRTEWSARPDGALCAVITGEYSPAALIDAIHEYEAELPGRLEDTRQLLAACPDTGAGRDRAAVLASLVEALEKLQAQLGETA